MAICDIVVELANAIHDAGELTPTQDLVTYEVRSMPLYRDIGRLDLWDSVTRPLLNLLDGDESPIGQILTELIEFAAHNLYGAIDESGTLAEYQILACKLVTHGISTPLSVDLSNW